MKKKTINLKVNDHYYDLPISPNTSLRQLVSLYQELFRQNLQRYLDGFMRLEFSEAVKIAASGKEADGKHIDHLRCLETKALTKAQQILLSHIKKLEDCNTFDELHDKIKGLISKFTGYGPMYFYDVALRIGVSNGIWPGKVYLQCGAETGAKNLGLEFKIEALEYSAFPSELNCLNAAQIEDFLCIFGDCLK